MNQRFEVRWADDVHAAGKFLRSKRQSCQCRVTAIRTAHDRDPLRIGVVFLDGPIHRVDQVVVHFEAPLFVAGVEEFLSVAGRAAIVHLQAGVAAVRKPLRVGIVTPGVASPRAAMHEKNQRQVLRRHTDRPREVAMQIESVARLDDDRLHRRELQAFELRLVHEQKRSIFGDAVPGVIAERTTVGRERHQPGRVSIVAVDDDEIAVVQLGNTCKVRFDGRVHHIRKNTHRAPASSLNW